MHPAARDAFVVQKPHDRSRYLTGSNTLQEGAAVEETLLSYFSNQNLTRDMTPGEIKYLVSCMKIRRYKPGEVIVEEGKRYDMLFYIFNGDVDVLKYDESGKHQFAIHRLGNDTFFGEMSFIDEKPASATIVAKTGCTIYSLDRAAIKRNTVFNKMILNITKDNISRLRETNESYVKSIKSELEQTKIRMDFGLFYVITLILSTMTQFIPKPSGLSPLLQIFFSWGALIMLTLPIILFIKKMKKPIADFGVNATGWGKSALEGILISLLMIPVIYLYKHFSEPDAPFITWSQMGNYPPFEFWLYIFGYSIHSVIQEFIARGVIQGSLQRFMAGSHFLVPIFVVSLMFGSAHIHISVQFGILTFVMSFLFGLIYYRHRNIIGVSIVHYSLGVLAMAAGWF
jgi:CRP-like cAMP-binding protein